MSEEPSKDIILSYLESLLASKSFAKAPRLCDFLRYIVTKSASGDAAHLKGANIGVDLYGRAPTDTSGDNPVRVIAGRARKVLRLHYAGAGADDPIHITIPVGGYVAHFKKMEPTRRFSAPTLPKRYASDATTTDNASITRPETRMSRLILGGLVASLILAAAIWFSRGETQNAPSQADVISALPIVDIRLFDNLTGNSENEHLGRGIQMQLAGDLEKFQTIRVHIGDTSADDRNKAADYIVSGELLAAGDTIDILVRLMSVANREELFIDRVRVNAEGSDYVEVLQRITSQLSGRVSGPEGAIIQAEMQNASNQWEMSPLQSEETEVFLCYSLMKRYEASSLFDDFTEAFDCAERAMALHPSNSTLYSIKSFLTMSASPARRGFSVEELSKRYPGQAFTLLESEQQAERAIQLNPSDDTAHHYLAHAQWASAKYEEAEISLRRAIALNRGSSETLADLSLLLANSSEWDEALMLSEEAVARSVTQRGWHFIPPYLYALKQRDGQEMQRLSAIFRENDSSFANVLSVIAASVANDQAGLNIYLARLEEAASAGGTDPLSVVRQVIHDQTLISMLEAELVGL